MIHRLALKSSFLKYLLAIALLAGCSLQNPGAARAQTAEAVPGAGSPMAVVAISSIDQLLEDLRFLGNALGQPQMAAQMQPMVVGFTQGLDTSKPIGLIVNNNQGNYTGSVCVGVKDLNAFLQMLRAFNVNSTQEADGTYKLATPGQTIFLKQADDWAFLSATKDMLADVPANPGEVFKELTSDYDLALQLNVQNVPEAFRQMAVQQLQAGMQSGMEKLPEEGDEEFARRQEGVRGQVEQIQRLISEMDKFLVGLSIDSAEQRTFFDFVYSAVPSSQLAQQIAINNNPKTDYAGFIQPDAPMMLSFASKLTEDDVAQVELNFAAMENQIASVVDQVAEDLDASNREALKSAITDFTQAYQESLKAGKMDGGALLNMSADSLSFVAGGFTADPAQVKSGYEKLAKTLQDVAEDKGREVSDISENVDSVGDVNFHQFTVEMPEDKEKARQLFGEEMAVVLGVGDESSFIALGSNPIELAKQVFSASSRAPQREVLPAEMIFSLKPILEAVAAWSEDEQSAQLEMIAQMLANETPGRDHVRMSVEMVDDTARTRFEVEEGALRAIGMAAMAAQMRQMQETGQPAAPAVPVQ